MRKRKGKKKKNWVVKLVKGKSITMVLRMSAERQAC